MDHVQQLQNKLVDFTWELFREEVLDEKYREFHSYGGHDVVNATVTEFWATAGMLANEARRQILEQQDNFREVYELLFRMKGGAMCIGAARVARACNALQNFCINEPNREGCLRLLEQLQQDICVLKTSWETLKQMESEIVNAGGRVVRWW